jgi:hypothetical protein
MITSDDFEERGKKLIEELKIQVLNALAKDPAGHPNGNGLGNSEIERLAGLEIPLDRPPQAKQEHWLTWTIIQRLVADGLIESIHTKRTRYRLVKSLMGN